MGDNLGFVQFVFWTLFTVVLGMCIGEKDMVSNTEITSTKVFKVDDATYKCKQLNKLEYGK